MHPIRGLACGTKTCKMTHSWAIHAGGLSEAPEPEEARAEKRESSVLFSLRELRQLEDERVEKEQNDLAARLAAEAQAKADAERRAREEEERKVREEQERIRAEQERRENAEREERIRIAESERRAQVEAQMKLEQERLQLEHQAALANAPKKSHKLLYGIVAAMSIIVIALGVVYYRHSQKAEADRKRAAQELADLQKVLDDTRAEAARIDGEIATIQNQIATANEDDRKKLLAQLEAKRKEAAANQERADAAQKRIRGGGSSKPKPKGPGLDLNVDTGSALGGTKGK